MSGSVVEEEEERETEETNQKTPPAKKKKNNNMEDMKEMLQERDEKLLSTLQEMQSKQNELLTKLIEKLA